MKIAELKKIIENLPDDMMVGLLDATTDDRDDMNYFISEEDVFVEDCWKEDNETGEPDGKMLFITFENKLNENSILL